MSYTTWTPPAQLPEIRAWSGWAWRIIEAQHIAATMKLVDSAAEQDVLENLLETSKPAMTPTIAGLDYLLAAPFRYAPPAGGSRFRSESDPGVFYGAENTATACAELGYWRWRFLRDSVDLLALQPVAHTAFRVKLATQTIDLRMPPYHTNSSLWLHPSDYSATQALGRTARNQALGGIIYQSVRNPEPRWCIAVLTPTAFAGKKPDKIRENWWLSVQQDTVIWRKENQAFVFDMTVWMN